MTGTLGLLAMVDCNGVDDNDDDVEYNDNVVGSEKQGEIGGRRMGKKKF